MRTLSNWVWLPSIGKFDMNKKCKNLLVVFSLMAMLAVILGAFGAHGLKSRIPEASLTSFRTGVQYQFYHSLAGIIITLCLYLFKHNGFYRSAQLIFAGIILFSGSIYLLTTQSLTNIGFTSILGPLTPMGGLLFILAWGIFIFTLIKMPQGEE